jgi:imidazolonepropionase-like amidohydrolase
MKATRILTALCGLLALGLNDQTTAQPTTVLFQNVRIFDGTRAELSAPSQVLVRGGVIEKISAQAIQTDKGSGTKIIDGSGRTLMPGLIDNHVHLFMSANSQAQMIGPDARPEAMHERAAKEAKLMLLRGFTAARDVGGPVCGLKKDIDQGKSIGPRIYPRGAMLSPTSGHGDSRTPDEKSRRFFGKPSKGELLGVNFIADGRDEVLTATRENLRFGATQIKVMAGGGAASEYDPLDVTQYTLDEMKAAVEAADDWGTYVTVHAYTPKAVRRAVEAGVKCIEHGQLLDEDTVKLLGEKGIWLSLQALDPAPSTAHKHVRAKKQLVVDGTANVYQWAKKHRVKLAWGTDFLFNPAHNKNQNADLLKLTQWFTPAEILSMVTHDNAELLALSGPRNPYPGKLGVIEEGALADLLLVDGDPLAKLELIADPERNIVVIVKDGIIYKNILKP